MKKSARAWKNSERIHQRYVMTVSEGYENEIEVYEFLRLEREPQRTNPMSRWVFLTSR